MASNNDLSLERTRGRGRRGGRERSARNATGILRGGFAGERKKRKVKSLMFPGRERGRERERERDGLAARDIIADDDDIGNDFARRRG